MTKLSKKLTKTLTDNINSLTVWQTSVANAQREMNGAETGSPEHLRAIKDMGNAMRWYNEAAQNIMTACPGVSIVLFRKMDNTPY